MGAIERLDGTEAPTISGNGDPWRIETDGRTLTLDHGAGFDALYEQVKAITPESDDSPTEPSHRALPPLRLKALMAAMPAPPDDEAWFAPDAAARDARIASRLLLLRRDPLELSQELPERALASLATAESAGRDLPLARSIIAWSLGYKAYARHVAADELATSDTARENTLSAWRQYTHRELTESGEGDGALARYLTLRASAERERSLERWQRQARAARSEGVGPVAVYHTAYAMDGWRHQLTTMITTPYRIVTIAGGETKPELERFLARGWELAARSDGAPKRYDDAIDVLSDALPPGYSDPAQAPVEALHEALPNRDGSPNQRIERELLLSAFYGAIHERIILQMERRSVYQQAAERIDALKATDAAPAKALARLHEQRLAGIRGRQNKAGPFIETAASVPFGPWAREPLLRSALARTPQRHGAKEKTVIGFTGLGASPAKRFPLPANRPRPLDGRPGDEALLRDYARAALSRPDVAELLRDRIIDERGPADAGELVRRRAKAHGNPSALLELGHNEAAPVFERARALEELADHGEADKVRDALGELMASHPRAWSAREALVEVLRDQGDHRRAMRIAQGFCTSCEYASSWDVLHARMAGIRAAMAFRPLDKLYAAAKELRDKHGAARTYHLMIDILDEAGSRDDADWADGARQRRVARQLVDRYPHSLQNRTPLMRLQVCDGEWSAAAGTLADHGPPINDGDWQYTIAPAIADCFSDAPEKAASLADHLQQVGYKGLSLRSLADGLAKQDRPNAAHEFAAALSSEDAWSRTKLNIIAAHHLARAADQATATGWLAKRLPGKMLGSAMQPIYRRGLHEALWEIIPLPDRPEHRAYIQTLRAASLAVRDANQPQRRARLEAAFAEGDTTPFHGMARVLLGLDAASDYSQRPIPAKYLPHASYFLAVEAARTGRPDDAISWLAAAKAAGARHPGAPAAWAKGLLNRVIGDAAWRRQLDKHGPGYLMPWSHAHHHSP